jgi:hypothetical protein
MHQQPYWQPEIQLEETSAAWEDSAFSPLSSMRSVRGTERNFFMCFFQLDYRPFL